jgi:hypothetical protein
MTHIVFLTPAFDDFSIKHIQLPASVARSKVSWPLSSKVGVDAHPTVERLMNRISPSD